VLRINAADGAWFPTDFRTLKVKKRNKNEKMCCKVKPFSKIRGNSVVESQTIYLCSCPQHKSSKIWRAAKCLENVSFLA